MTPTTEQAALVVNTGSRRGAEAFEEAHRLLVERGVDVAEAFSITDPARLRETVEQAVERALRDGLARERERRAVLPSAGGPERVRPADDEDQLLQDVRAIARRFQEHAAGRPLTSLDHGELLYDEAGLPR